MPKRVEYFATGSYYHIFNRGVDKSNIFKNAIDYRHFISSFDFYRYIKNPVKFSKYCSVSKRLATQIRDIQEQSGTLVSILAFALMPNHFHLLVKQEAEHGIHSYLFKSLNSYAKYANTKRHRVGPVFQGNFKAVQIESEEQLLHVSRYIHLNPVTAGIVSLNSLHAYPWTSFPQYLNTSGDWINTSDVLGIIGSRLKYEAFVSDHAGYAKKLAAIRHLVIDGEETIS